MDDKEIERKLKRSAKKIKVKPFDSRWESIKDQIDDGNTCIKEELVPEAVSVGVEGNAQKSVHKKRIYLLSAFVLVCMLVLAITLPFVLKQNKPNNRMYFKSSELLQYIANEEEFYDRIEESHISVIDFSRYNLETFNLLVTSENIVKGGLTEYVNEDENYLVYLEFYSEDVIEIPQVKDDYVEYKNNKATIKYQTTTEEDGYLTIASTQYNNINYYFEIITLDENLEKIFDEIFS